MRNDLPIDVSVVVPTYCEADNIALLAPRVAAALEPLKPLNIGWELVIVDDDSRDGTDVVCEKLVAEGLPVRLIVRTDERDLSTAVVHGFNQARGRILIAMDADLSHPPEALPDMRRRIDDGADFAIASRFTAGGAISDDWPWWRLLASRVAALPAAPITKVSDPMSGFFAVSRRCFEQAAPLRPIGYKIALELLAKCPVKDVAEVPIRFTDRQIGKSKVSLKQAFLYLRHLRLLYHHVYPNWSETLHFLSIGATGVVVDIAAYLLLVHSLDVHHVSAKALSFVAASVSNWALNRRYSFVRAEKPPLSQQLPKFLAVAAIGAMFNVALYWLLTTLSAWFSAHRLAALLVATVVTSAWNFLASKLLVFKTAFR